MGIYDRYCSRIYSKHNWLSPWLVGLKRANCDGVKMIDPDLQESPASYPIDEKTCRGCQYCETRYPVRYVVKTGEILNEFICSFKGLPQCKAKDRIVSKHDLYWSLFKED